MKSNKSFNLSKYSKALNKQFALQEKEKSSVMKTLKSEKLKINQSNKILFQKEKKIRPRSRNNETIFLNMYKLK